MAAQRVPIALHRQAKPWRAATIAVALAPLHCGTARPLRPLPAGHWAAELSLPGLWISNPPLTFPVGTAVIGGRYGLTEATELRLRWHPLPTLMGIVVLEGGGVWHVRRAVGLWPALHVSGDLSVATKPAFYTKGFARSFRGALDGALTAHYEPWDWLWPYVVLDNAWILADQTYVGSLFVGLQLHPSAWLEVSVETGWAGFTDDSARRTQPYLTLGGQGVLWSSVALALRFDGGSLAASAPPEEGATP